MFELQHDQVVKVEDECYRVKIEPERGPGEIVPRLEYIGPYDEVRREH